LARAAKRMPLDNANQPAELSLSEVERADMEVFLCRSANGRIEWKAADGRILKEPQEAEAGQ
jgi:hypothetical protein